MGPWLSVDPRRYQETFQLQRYDDQCEQHVLSREYTQYSTLSRVLYYLYFKAFVPGYLEYMLMIRLVCHI